MILFLICTNSFLSCSPALHLNHSVNKCQIMIRGKKTYIFWSAGRQRALQLDSCMTKMVKRWSLDS